MVEHYSLNWYCLLHAVLHFCKRRTVYLCQGDNVNTFSTFCVFVGKATAVKGKDTIYGFLLLSDTVESLIRSGVQIRQVWITYLQNLCQKFSLRRGTKRHECYVS